MKNNYLVAHRFDRQEHELVGEPVPLTDHVTTAGNSNRGTNLSASNNCILVTRRGSSLSGDSYLIWTDRRGEVLDTIAGPNFYSDVRLSDDGSKIAVSIIDQVDFQRDIFIHDIQSRAVSQLQRDNTAKIVPVWSPDGSRVAYTVVTGAVSQLDSASMFWKRVNRLDEPVRIASEDSLACIAMEWTEDNRIVYAAAELPTPPNAPDIRVLRLNEPDKYEVLVDGPRAEIPRGLSPDLRYVLYDEFGGDYRSDVYVLDTETRNRWQISTLSARDADPSWRSDGKEIYFFRNEQLLMVPVSFENGLSFGKPEPLFSIRRGNLFFFALHTYDVSHDGQRFLFAVPATSQEPGDTDFEVVVNWHVGLGE